MIRFDNRADLMPGFRTPDVFRVFVGSVLLVLVVYVVWPLISKGWDPGFSALACEYTLIFMVAFGVGVLGVRFGKVNWTAIGFRPCSLDWIIRALLVVPLFFALAAVVAASTKVVDSYFAILPDDELIFDSGSFVLIGGLSLAMIIFTPIIQEALLRGILFAWLRRHINFWISAIVSSIIFGVLHIGITRPGTVIIFGVVAAAFYEKSKSLWPAIAMHMAVNIVYVLAMLTT